jgi:hypothetical protein
MFPSACSFIVLVFTVSLHVSAYMAIFKCVGYFIFLCLKDSAPLLSLSFLTLSHSACFHQWGGLNMRYYYLLFKLFLVLLYVCFYLCFSSVFLRYFCCFFACVFVCLFCLCCLSVLCCYLLSGNMQGVTTWKKKAEKAAKQNPSSIWK